MHYVITVKARDGIEAERHVDNSEARAITYFRVRFLSKSPAPTYRLDSVIAAYLRGGVYSRRPMSYACSYNGGMATIEVSE